MSHKDRWSLWKKQVSKEQKDVYPEQQRERKLSSTKYCKHVSVLVARRNQFNGNDNPVLDTLLQRSPQWNPKKADTLQIAAWCAFRETDGVPQNVAISVAKQLRPLRKIVLKEAVQLSRRPSPGPVLPARTDLCGFSELTHEGIFAK